MSHSQEMANMTKRLEDKTHATRWEPKELENDWKAVKRISLQRLCKEKDMKETCRTWPQHPFAPIPPQLLLLRREPLAIPHRAEGRDSCLTGPSSKTRRPLMVPLAYTYHSPLHTYQSTLVNCAMVCLAQGWRRLAIYEINKSFLFIEHMFLVKRFIEAHSSFIKHVDVFWDRQSNF